LGIIVAIMKITGLSLVFSAVFLLLSGCLPKAGCTDNTAENYDPEAEEWDGSCIPSRDKLIGEFTYTRKWTDIVTTRDTVSFGTMQITESNVANNAFVMNLDGQLVLRGVITAFDIILDPYSKQETYQGFPFTMTASGTGVWLQNDTVDAVLNITAKVPVVSGTPPAFTEYNQPFDYYLTKR
jgi:hypothetical protein